MNTTKNALPSLPRLPRARKGSSGVCLCGCLMPTTSRFAPGHDSRLLACALRVERGLWKEAPEPHTAAVAIEVKLRAKAGLTGESHAKAQITAQDAAGIERKPVKRERKPRLVKTPGQTLKAAAERIGGAELDATGTDGQ